MPSFSGDGPDLLLRDGVFHTVVGQDPVEGSVIVDDGRIAFLGPAEEAASRIGSATRIVDLNGRAVTPGLIDAHAHLVGLGRSLGEVDLVATASYEEVVARIRAAAASVPAGEWITGRGWDQNDWPEPRFPEHSALSSSVPDHPVWVRRIDGHAALLNAKAMEQLGIGPDIEDPVGGRFLRDEAGRPTGVLIDAAMDVVSAGMPEPSVAQRKRWILDGAAHCLERGLTTVTDMGVGERDYTAYAELREQGSLPLRVALFLEDDEELLEGWFDRGPAADDRDILTVRGVKLYADGALGSRGAALLEPYADDPGNLGLTTATSAHLEDVCRRALASGFQVGVHAIGDRGALISLDAIESCFAGRPRPDARFRLEHAQVMRLQDIDRLAGLGVIASVQPTHATSDMPWAPARLGESRLRGAYAWQRMKAAGVVLALGSDFPVEKADPLLGFHAAITRQDPSGYPPGGWLPGQRLSRAEALRGFTLDAAHSLFLERQTGSLEVGKRADMVVYARDPMRVPAGEIPDLKIDMTIVGGRVAFMREDSR